MCITRDGVLTAKDGEVQPLTSVILAIRPSSVSTAMGLMRPTHDAALHGSERRISLHLKLRKISATQSQAMPVIPPGWHICSSRVQGTYTADCFQGDPGVFKQPGSFPSCPCLFCSGYATMAPSDMVRFSCDCACYT